MYTKKGCNLNFLLNWVATYPGGKGPVFTGVTLGVAAATAVEADVPGLGLDAVCEEPAATAVVSSCWSEQPLADTWEEPSEAGASLSSLGEELLEEAGDRSKDKGRGEKRKSDELIHICSNARCYTHTHTHWV